MPVFRNIILVMWLTSVSIVAFLFAVLLRFDFDIAGQIPIYTIRFGLLFLVFARLTVYVARGVFRFSWRHFSLTEFFHLFAAHILSSVLFTALVLLFRLPEFPRSILFIEFMISFLAIAGSGVLLRVGNDRQWKLLRAEGVAEQRDAIVVGAGDTGHLLVKTLLDRSRIGFHPVAVLDDNQRLKGTSVHGVRIQGQLSELIDLLRTYPSVSVVLLAIPSISEAKRHELERVCNQMMVLFKELRSFEDAAIQDVAEDDPEAFVESLLKRPLNISHSTEVLSEFIGKKVLITGAGGSIGSELVRQVAGMQPAKIIFFDNGEFNLFNIEREVSQRFTALPISVVIGDVRNEQRVDQVWRQEKPDIVIHAAAYKHVPLMEANVSEAFSTNVLGTLQVLRASISHKARRFVLISSDKAVNPESVMGCSKRLAELVVCSELFNSDEGFSSGVVRFGNVVNSTGSAIPIFREQILSGGPITVTDPNMERYFMSIKEAVHLVISASILCKRGELFVLEMGQKVKVIDVVNRMLALYGRKDVSIKFIGLRPGERLTESILSDSEESEKTEFEKISKVINNSGKDTDFLKNIDELAPKYLDLSDEALSRIMFKLVQQGL